MQQNRFIDQVRQYASLSRARGVSYGEQVLQLRALRFETIDSVDGTPEEMTAMKDKVDAFIMREYAKFDGSFKLPETD